MVKIIVAFRHLLGPIRVEKYHFRDYILLRTREGEVLGKNGPLGTVSTHQRYL